MDKDNLTAPSSEKGEEWTLICPDCGSPINRKNWGYGCSNYKNGCRFAVGKICEKELTYKQMETLLEKGRTREISGFKKKNGDTFSAVLELVKEETAEGSRHLIKFASRNPHKVSPEEIKEIYARCPVCHARMVGTAYGWQCEEKCGIFVPYQFCGRRISQAEAECLLIGHQTGILNGFVSKEGKRFSAGLCVEDGKIKFYFPERSY